MPRTSPSTLPPSSPADDADALTYFWELIESRTADDVRYLWPDFDRWRRELAALAKREDVGEILRHLVLALGQSELFGLEYMSRYRAAVLSAIQAAPGEARRSRDHP